MAHPHVARLVPVALLSLTLVFASVMPASAHDGLISSSPAADSTVSSELRTVELTFSQNFLTVGSSTAAFAVQVKGPDSKFYNLGCVRLSAATIATDVALGDSGSYQVLWQVVSSDGHTTSDDYSFKYTRPENVEAEAGADSGVTCDPATGLPIVNTPSPTPTPSAAAVSPTPAATAAEPSGFIRALPWILGGLAAMALGAAGFVVQYRLARRRTSL